MGPGKRTHLEHLLLSGMSGVVSFKTLDTFQILTREKGGLIKKGSWDHFSCMIRIRERAGGELLLEKKKSNKSILSVLIRGG